MIRLEDNVAKGEIAQYKQFVLWQQSFHSLSAGDALNAWERVNVQILQQKKDNKALNLKFYFLSSILPQHLTINNSRLCSN